MRGIWDHTVLLPQNLENNENLSSPMPLHAHRHHRIWDTFHRPRLHTYLLRPKVLPRTTPTRRERRL